MHSTRSTVARYSEKEEWGATVNYVRSGAAGLGWSVTVAGDLLAEHMAPNEWGWNARAASSQYLAAEFAQSTSDKPISDGAVETFCWWVLNRVLPRWPDLPFHFPLHSELASGIRDGKTDAFPRGDPRGEDLRRRLMAWLV